MINRRSFLQSAAAGGVLAATPSFISAALNSEDMAKMIRHDKLNDICRKIPKAESHAHFPGIVYPDIALQIAKKNGINKLSYSAPEDLWKTINGSACWNDCYREWISWFSLYKSVSREYSNILRSPADVHATVMNWVERALLPSNTRYAEVSIYHPRIDGGEMNFDSLMQGFIYARRDAADLYGIDLRYIGAVRLLGEDKLGRDYQMALKGALEMVDDFLRYKDELPLVAMTCLEEMAADITVIDPIYKVTRENGLHTTCHLGFGEKNGAKRMWDGLLKMGLERIDHGYLGVHDEKLMQYLADNKIPLTVVPLNNVGKIYREPRGGDRGESWNYETYPFKEFYERGIIMSIDTDIPGFNNNTQAEEYLVMAQVYNYGVEDIGIWARNSFKTAFLTPEEERTYLEELDTWVNNYKFVRVEPKRTF